MGEEAPSNNFLGVGALLPTQKANPKCRAIRKLPQSELAGVAQDPM